MCDVCVQSMHQRWSLQNDANARVAMTVDPPLMTLRQAKPALQIEDVRDLLKLPAPTKSPARKLIITVAIC